MNKKVKKRRPAYMVIRETLKQEILDGKHRELSESRLIQRFQVSSATARRVLNDLADDGLVVRQVGRGSIVIKADDREFKEFGVVFFDVFDPQMVFIADIVRGIEDAAKGLMHHLHMFTTRGHDIDDQGGTVLSSLVSRRKLDGVFVISPLPAESIAFFQRERLPCVCVGNHYPGLRVSSVMPDHGAAVRTVCQKLQAGGARRIALINLRREQSDVERGRDFIRRAWHKCCGRRTELLREVVDEGSAAKQAMRDLRALPAARRPDAVVAASDNLAAGVQAFMADCHDWRPAVVCFSDRHGGHANEIVSAYYEQGQTAFALMLELSGNPDMAPAHVRLPMDLHFKL